MKLQYKKTWLVIVSVFLFFVSYSVNAAGTPPEFRANGQTYSNYTQIDSTHWTVEDTQLKATITDLGNNQWDLSLQAKQTINNVYFPWMSQRQPLDGDVSDEIYYTPNLNGFAERAVDMNNSMNTDYKYPGGSSANWMSPVVVLADNDDALIVAATNFPARRVNPEYGSQKILMHYYDAPQPAGTTLSYGAIIARVKGNEATGQVPWQIAADYYKNWLNSKMPRPNYPAWMDLSQGILHAELEIGIDIPTVNNLFQKVKADFPWIVFWGQMPGGGCCVPAGMSTTWQPTLDPKYVPALSDFSKSVVAGGNHVAYYSSPYHLIWSMPSDQQLQWALSTSQGLDWLTRWMNYNLSQGADSNYIDTLSGVDWKTDPGIIRDYLLNGKIPTPAIMENPIDAYPIPYLAAGSFTTAALCHAPFMDRNPLAYSRVFFPRFGKYILGDRIMYTGVSNGDWVFWGDHLWQSSCAQAYCTSNGPCAHGSERMVFILGNKFDYPVNEPNSIIMDAVIAERKRVNWWVRRPTFLDTKDLNLTTIPLSSKVEISHFKDNQGKDLLAVSNPLLQAGLSFSMAGQTFQVPTQKIAIIDTGAAIAPTPTPISTPAILKGDLNKDGIVNSLDWSLMNSKWFTSDSTADLNVDGIVNSLDFSIMNGNWLKSG